MMDDLKIPVFLEPATLPESLRSAGRKNGRIWLYEHQGRTLTVTQLAQMAGCNSDAMRLRLKNMSPERAIALGAATLRRKYPGKGKAPGSGAQPKPVLYRGEFKTIAELAALAGCSEAAMRKRVKRAGVDVAMSQGAKAPKGPAPKPRQPKPPRVAKPKPEPKSTAGNRARVVMLNGQPTTVRAMATTAGCSYETMRARLANMTPERAMELGAADQSRNAAMRRDEVKAKRAARAKAKCPVPRDDDFRRRIKPGSKLEAMRQPKMAAPAGEIVIPANVKRVVGPACPDRFAVDPKRLLFSFGRIGEYLSTGSVIERAMGQKC